MDIYTNYIDYCHELLFKNSKALEYLYSRHLTDDLIRSYKIGFSPNNWSIADDVPFSQSFNMHFPVTKWFLVNKIIIPNYSFKGDLSGLTVRTYGDAKKFYRKWIIRQKLPHWSLYGFYQNQESIKKTRRVIVVESFFDMVAIQKWVPNIISAQTAFLCDFQISFLKRYVDHIIFAFNNDYNKSFNTGKELMKKMESTCRSVGIRSSKLSLPQGINDFSDFRTLNNDLGDYLKERL